MSVFRKSYFIDSEMATMQRSPGGCAFVKKAMKRKDGAPGRGADSCNSGQRNDGWSKTITP
jgi:hypothetical protein